MLRVCNGTVRLWTGNGTLYMRGKGSLRMEGTNSLAQVACITCTDAALEFVPPEDAAVVTAPYIQTRGTVSFDADSVLRVLNAEKCAVNGGGTYTLLSNSNTDITGVIQHIEASPDVTVTQTARSIVVHIADRSNTLILLR